MHPPPSEASTSDTRAVVTVTNCDSRLRLPTIDTMGSGTGLAGSQESQALRHFVLQAERPPGYDDVALETVDPVLRGLLFTDGTVTRTLEVQLLAATAVEVISQESTSTSAQVAAKLDASEGVRVLCRRVVIGAGEPPAPLIWAESHILPSRLPPGFLAVLRDAQDGIGESLQNVQLESWRELLWFGLGAAPAWSGSEAGSVITRLYRVITAGRPALLISESFAVSCRDGVYCLDCPGRVQAAPNSASIS